MDRAFRTRLHHHGHSPTTRIAVRRIEKRIESSMYLAGHSKVPLSPIQFMLHIGVNVADIISRQTTQKVPSG
jgi:hypothetical protein